MCTNPGSATCRPVAWKHVNWASWPGLHHNRVGVAINIMETIADKDLYCYIVVCVMSLQKWAKYSNLETGNSLNVLLFISFEVHILTP